MGVGRDGPPGDGVGAGIQFVAKVDRHAVRLGELGAGGVDPIARGVEDADAAKARLHALIEGEDDPLGRDGA